MDYEKKYKEALERARAYFENENYTEMADVFPELKESEDERIRKEIVHYILYDAKGVSEEQEHAWISYLEKQKEQKPDTRDSDDLQLLGFIHDLLNEIEWKDKWAMSKEECLRRINNYRPQKLAEWDEFDEDFLKRAIWYVENPAPYVVKDTNLALWLKLLHTRFQPKQEWRNSHES